MPHVTFIHGIANKPPIGALLEEWQSHLADGGLDLEASGVSSSMVYWADVVYAHPVKASSNYESVKSDLATVDSDSHLAWMDSLPAEERLFAESLILKLGVEVAVPGDDEPPLRTVPIEGDKGYEAIPLPWPIKKRVMRRLLKDVHHYLFNTRFSPREGEEYETQTHLRKLFVDQLRHDSQGLNGRHVVVSHSMGTVISYDCLKNVEECPEVDGFMTVGSPLGLSEIHDNFKPGYHKSSAFPTLKVKGDWVNINDRLDPVAFDTRLGNDYRRDDKKVILDERVSNSGVWRHSMSKYLGQESLCNHLRTLLDL